MSAHPSLLEGPVRPHLVRLALPMAIGIVLIIANNLVDTYFVSLLGEAELAAMSFTFPVVGLVLSLAMGLAIGATATIARAIGQGDTGLASRLTTHACILAAVVVVLVSGLGVLSQRLLFSALGAGPQIMPLLVDYMTIWYGSALFLVVPMVGTGAMRADGDAKTPMRLMALAAGVNMALDPLLIFGLGPVPALGIRGAAIATVIANAVLLLATAMILHRRHLIEWHWPKANDLLSSWKRILSVGVPAAISGALTPIATAVLTAIIARYGADAVAAYGVASRVEGLILIPAMAIGSAMTPFVGQNWGGHHEERVRDGLRQARIFVLLWGLFAWLVVALLGRQIGAIFSDHPATLDAVQHYLWIVPASYGAAGIVSVVSSVFNAVDRAVRATLLSAIRSLVLALPLAALGAWLFGLLGIFVGLGLATMLTAVLAAAWAKSALRPLPSLKPVADAQALKRAQAEVRARVNLLLSDVTDHSSLVAAARPINTIGFFAAGYEVGHVHKSGKVDFHVPPPLYAALLKDGLAQPHRHHESDQAWLSSTLDSDDDAHEAAWLLGVLGALRALAAGGIDRAAFDALAARDDPGLHLHPALDASIDCVTEAREALFLTKGLDPYKLMLLGVEAPAGQGATEQRSEPPRRP